jgi:hypothetical protein
VTQKEDERRPLPMQSSLGGYIVDNPSHSRLYPPRQGQIISGGLYSRQPFVVVVYIPQTETKNLADWQHLNTTYTCDCYKAVFYREEIQESNRFRQPTWPGGPVRSTTNRVVVPGRQAGVRFLCPNL